jgi:hypothetical protein
MGEVGISTEKKRLGDGSLGTGISWREILKREFEFSDTANLTTPPPGGCA